MKRKKFRNLLYKAIVAMSIIFLMISSLNAKKGEAKTVPNSQNQNSPVTGTNKMEGISAVNVQGLKESTMNDSNKMFTYQSLPQHVIEKIKYISWHPESPMRLEELAYVKVVYWSFDEQRHQGELIVNKKLAKEVIDIFKELYEARFPIEKIRLIDEYEGDDVLSMEDNNTSAFCTREVTGKKGVYSKHSYGIAIDINPVQNPYIKGNEILPVIAKSYINRKNIRKGMILKDDICYKAFTNRGWTWGGEWKSLKDYQHFEKNID